MPWRPLSRIAVAICAYPFHPFSSADLPLQLGDELYIIEEGGNDWAWFRGYLVAPPSLISGLTSKEGQPLEARIFSGIFPRVCVEIREFIGDVISNGTNAGIERHGSTPLASGDGVSEQELLHTGTNKAVTERDGESEIGKPHAAAEASKTQSRSQKPLAPVPMLKIGDETATSQEEPLVDEIASCLREWHSVYLHKLLLSRRYDVLEELSMLVNRLDIVRRQLLHNILTAQELHALRQSAVWDLIHGNRLLSGEVIVRSLAGKGRILTSDDSAIEMSQLQSTMSLLREQPAAQTEARTLHHVLVELKSLQNEIDSHVVVSMSLYSRALAGKPTFVSEAFSMDVFGYGLDDRKVDRPPTRTLFTDLNSSEMNDAGGGSTSLYLVIKAVTNVPSRGSSLNSGHRAFLSRDAQSYMATAQGGLKSPALKNNRRSILWSTKSRREQDSATYLSMQRPSTDLSIESHPPRHPPAPYGDNRKSFKRTMGIGVVDISNFSVCDRESEHSVVIWSPAEHGGQFYELEDWDEIIETLLPTESGRYCKSSTLTSATILLRSFSNADPANLIRETPTLLQGVQTTQRAGFAGGPLRPRSDIYVTLSRPFLPENAWLSHPRSGSVAIPSDLAMQDVQLTLEVRDASGARIENCVHPASNSSGHTAWRSTAVAQGDYWNQVIKLAISPEKVPGAHIVMSLADAGNFPFALCWMPLWIQGAFIADGDHALALHKYDEVTSNIVAGKGAYLSLPWTAKSEDKSVFGPVAAIHLQTYLCSTKYSQDSNLLGLLRWRERRSDEVLPLLRRFQFVPAIEVVKLLGDVLDALFDVLVEYTGNEEAEDLVLDCLVNVLGTAHDRRFDLQPLVDEYAAVRFKFAFAFPSLTGCFVRLLADYANPESLRRLHATCKVGRHLFKFIVTARRQQMAKEVGIGIKNPATFSRALQDIFGAFSRLMHHQSPALVGTKTLIVQNFHTWLPELLGVMTPNDILGTAVRFLDSCSEVEGRLVLHKLVLINLISAMDLFSSEVESAWISHVDQWMCPYWGRPLESSYQWREQVRLCCSVVATLITRFNGGAATWVPYLLQSYFSVLELPAVHTEGQTDYFSLLFPKTVPFPSKAVGAALGYDEALIEISALLSTILTVAPSFPALTSNELAETLFAMLRVFKSILDREAFPSSWLSLYVYHHKSVARGLEFISNILITTFLPPPDDAAEFPTDLWMEFFTVLLKVVDSEALAVETFPEQKRRAVWKIAGDVREFGAALLWRAWEAMGWEATRNEKELYGLTKIGGYQVQYVPRLVGPIVELCLSVHEGLRGTATAIMRTMIISEWVLTQDLAIIQAEVINCLDQLFQRRTINDEVLQKLFIEELLVLVQPRGNHRNDKLFSAVKALTDVIDHLLDLLVAVHNTEVRGDASHIMNTLRLMNFLRDMQKEDIYVLYVHKLAEIQISAGNVTEAGLALKMHADLYDWDSMANVPAIHDLSFPRQTSFERKEQIYFQMLKQFEEGSAWEEALAAYKELAHEYEYNVFDVGKLARTHRAMATIHESIAKGERQSSRFFWISFRGLGFPMALRDKQFIYQGLTGDRSASFTDRIQQQYPSAVIVGRGPLENLEGQYVSILPVSALKNYSHPINRRQKVSHCVREHYIFSFPRHFTTTPRRQASRIGLQDHGVEKIIFTTAEAFPTILRRSEIILLEKVHLPARYTAIERTLRKTHELLGLETSASSGGESAFRALTEALMILISRESGGSVVDYWTLTPPIGMGVGGEHHGLEARESELQLGEALKVALIEHALTIRRCLELYARPAHQATRAELTQTFETTFEDIFHYLERPQQRASTEILEQTQNSISAPSVQINPTINGVHSKFDEKELDAHPGSQKRVDIPAIASDRNDRQDDNLVHAGSPKKSRFSPGRKASHTKNLDITGLNLFDDQNTNGDHESIQLPSINHTSALTPQSPRTPTTRLLESATE